MKTNTVWGIGPKWAGIVAAYAVAITWLSYWDAAFLIPMDLRGKATVVAIALLVIGIPFWILSGRTMFRGVSAGCLITAGPYGLCRHPIYGSWIIFNIPALELLFHSWLGLTTSVFAYLLLRIMVNHEEDYLAEKFGENYLAYRRRVPFVLPIGFLRNERPAKPDGSASQEPPPGGQRTCQGRD